MPLVVVFHFTERGRLPRLGEEELKGIRSRFLEALKPHPDVTFYGTWVDEEGRGICLWEAPDPDVVKGIIEEVLGSPPADPVVEVRKVL